MPRGATQAALHPVTSSSSLFCLSTAFHFATIHKTLMPSAERTTREQGIAQQHRSDTQVFVSLTATLIYRRFLQTDAAKFSFQRLRCRSTLIDFHRVLTGSASAQNHCSGALASLNSSPHFSQVPHNPDSSPCSTWGRDDQCRAQNCFRRAGASALLGAQPGCGSR